MRIYLYKQAKYTITFYLILQNLPSKPNIFPENCCRNHFYRYTCKYSGKNIFGIYCKKYCVGWYFMVILVYYLRGWWGNTNGNEVKSNYCR